MFARTLLALVVVSGFALPSTAAVIDTFKDSFVYSNSAESNYGDLDFINVRRDGADQRKGYFAFDISGITDITNAEIVLYAYSTNVNGQTFELYGLTEESGDGWGEDTITYANAPANDTSGDGFLAGESTLLTDFSPSGVAVNGEIRISAASIQTFIDSDTDGIVTFMLRNANTGSSLGQFDSRERSYPPQLSYIIPEPASIVLLTMGAGLVFSRRRR